MPRPTDKSALEATFDAIEWTLKQVNHANGFYTNGLLVDRGMDPRVLRKNKPDEYDAKLAAVTLGLPSRVRDQKNSVGNRVRWQVTLPMFALCTMSEVDANADPADPANLRKLDGLVSELQDDLWRAFAQNFNIVEISNSLGNKPPVVIGMQVSRFDAGDVLLWPDAHMIGTAVFFLDEMIKRGNP